MRWKKKFNLLGEQASFSYVNLNMTQEEQTAINELHIINDDYSNFGKLETLEQELTDFFRYHEKNKEEHIQLVAHVITRTALAVIKASKKESAWISVTTSKPMNLFDIPRWHIDGCYFNLHDPYTEKTFKFAATLKGPCTLLHNLPTALRDIFNAHFEDRLYLASLIHPSTIEAAQKGQGVFFIVCDPLLSAVHSEPKLDTDRLFFSVLPGNISEIDELYTRWHEEEEEAENK